MTHAAPLSFPSVAPTGYPSLGAEPEFDAAKHLALEMPEKIISLEELGYSDQEIAECPSTLGITSCFRVLSDEGAACLQEVTRGLEQYARSIPRISRMVRGGAYQSKFLRDLCLSPDVTAQVSEICGSGMPAPHHSASARAFELQSAYGGGERRQMACGHASCGLCDVCDGSQRH